MTNKEIQELFEVACLELSEQSNLIYQKEINYLCRKFFEAGIKASNQEQIEISTADFEQWWNIYDKKRGREKCLQKWKKLTLKERQDCIKMTPLYVGATPDKQYRKDPLTYLNGKCWNDEIIVNNKIYGTRQVTTDTDRAKKLADILTD